VEVADGLARRAAETVADDDVSGELPVGHLLAISGSGLDAAFLPPEHGGEGLSYAALGAVVSTLAAAHPSVATVWLMHIGAAHALVSMSEPDVAAHFATELRSGKRFSNALSEPAGGNLFLAPQQDAEPSDGGWRLTGMKAFISGSELADYFFLNARVDGRTAFFGVPVDDTIGFPPIDTTMGMRATRSRSVRLDGTLLQRRYLCAAPPTGYTNLISAGFAFISIGIAESALDALAAYAVGKRSLGTPGGAATLGEASWVRSEVGMVGTELRAARLLAEQTMWLADRRDPEAMANATEAKLLANEVAKKAAALAVKVGGGSGYLQKSPIQRIFRDAQAGALMAYSVPFSQDLVGGWMLGG
jgi:alkylation response protein AidB-like acyl-CoA dehydrogenase